MSGSRRTDGSRGPSSKTPRSTPSIKAQKRSRSEQGQSGGKRVDKRKTGAADLKGREGEGTGPVANVEALRGRNGALEQETDQRPEVGKSEVEPAGIGPSCELPAVGDAIGGAEELGEPLSTQVSQLLKKNLLHGQIVWKLHGRPSRLL